MKTLLDLFSGIGGFSLAFEAQGFRTVAFSEIDVAASAVLKHWWPDVPNAVVPQVIQPFARAIAEAIEAQSTVLK